MRQQERRRLRAIEAWRRRRQYLRYLRGRPITLHVELPCSEQILLDLGVSAESIFRVQADNVVACRCGHWPGRLFVVIFTPTHRADLSGRVVTLSAKVIIRRVGEG